MTTDAEDDTSGAHSDPRAPVSAVFVFGIFCLGGGLASAPLLVVILVSLAFGGFAFLLTSVTAKKTSVPLRVRPRDLWLIFGTLGVIGSVAGVGLALAR